MSLEAICRAIEEGGLTPHEEATRRLVSRAARMGVLPPAAGEPAFQRRYLEAARIGVANRFVDALLRERLVPSRRLDATTFEIPLAHGAVVVQARRFDSFGRLLDIFRRGLVTATGERALDHPLQVFQAVAPLLESRFERARIERLVLEELPGSVANLALALGAEELERSGWRRRGVGTVRAWAQTFENPDQRRRAMEGMIWEGHSSHPCTKTRFEMAPAHSIRFAPELSRSPLQLGFVALREELAQRAGHDVQDLLAALWPGLRGEANQRLLRLGLEASRYVLLPVHPWQLQHRIPRSFGDLVSERALVRLDLEAPAWPQLSLRTVEPAIDGVPPYHLKLAIGVQTTSAERTISPQSVHNGPRFSALLESLASEAGLALRVIGEVGALGVEPDRIPGGAERARHLSVIVRDNPTAQAPGPGQNWLAAALVSRSPFSSCSLAAEWVHHLAGTRGLPLAEAARIYFLRFCQTLLTPTLALLSRYGVALEAHGQNTFFDLDDDGLPISLAIRDFGGLRIHRPTLEAAGHCVAMRKGSAPSASDLHEVRTKFSHCVLQSLLSDLIEALGRDLPGALPDPWAVVAATLRSCLAPDPSTLSELCRSPTRAKSLTTMRLTDRYNSYLYTEVPNPLRGSDV